MFQRKDEKHEWFHQFSIIFLIKKKRVLSSVLSRLVLESEAALMQENTYSSSLPITSVSVYQQLSKEGLPTQDIQVEGLTWLRVHLPFCTEKQRHQRGPRNLPTKKMHFRVSAGAKQHPNPQLISSKLLCIPFPRSAIILTAPAQKGTSGQMHLPVGCCTAAIEQHPATRFRHLDHDAKYVTLVSTPHLCSANRSIFSTGRRSERSVQLVTRLMLLWLQKTPKVR